MEPLLSNRLAELAANIAMSLSNIRDNIYPLCIDLAEARSKFADHISFGKWFDASGIHMNHQDRAAAIAMGGDPEHLEEVLAATTRVSIRHIYEEEFRFTHVGKTTTSTTPEHERALHVIERRKAAGESLSYREIQAEAGTSSTPVRTALKAAEAVEKVRAEADAALSASAQERLDAAIRAEKKKLALEFETLVRNEVNKRVDATITRYFQELKRVEDLLNSPRYAIMPISDYKKVLSCLHPDSALPIHKERFEEAFRLFNDYRIKLVDERADKDEVARKKRLVLNSVPLPRTLEEMLARKAAGQAERSRKRAERHA